MRVNELEDLAEEIRKFPVSITEFDLIQLMKIKRRWPLRYPWGQPSVEIINNVSNTHSPFYNDRGEFNYKEWRSLYNQGYTTILSDILDLTEQTRMLDTLLKTKIGNPVNGNFYWSRTGQLPSFYPHKHEYPVIVKQVYGNCTWKIGDKEIELAPGLTAIIPKQTEHAVLNKPEDKLSLTLNIQ